MKTLNTIYINGQHLMPHGTEVLTLLHPVSEQPVAQVRLADEEDTQPCHRRRISSFSPDAPFKPRTADDLAAKAA
ncbi:hypothetical protein [Cedecea davisae]|uniref:hypothetical protein n=1 Tax=Cedecea davisae TaxID=158484 RepID=UPI00242FBFF5|nr:hypothetical protein [Cedecea davisae]